jgi:hypothetical protein
MKLYAWQPKGHGQYSFFVCAENEDAAHHAVDVEVKRLRDEGSNYETDGWPSDYWELRIIEPETAIFNDNS